MAKAEVMGASQGEPTGRGAPSDLNVDAGSDVGALRMVIFPEGVWRLIESIADAGGMSAEAVISKALSEYAKNHGFS